jgi:hypothetical protein
MFVTEQFKNFYRQNAEIYEADNFVSFDVITSLVSIEYGVYGCES